MAPLNDYRESMNTAYESEPVRLVVSTQFLIKMGLAGFLVSIPHCANTFAEHSSRCNRAQTVR